jgi:predicted dienelactone hydrolase
MPPAVNRTRNAFLRSHRRSGSLAEPRPKRVVMRLLVSAILVVVLPLAVAAQDKCLTGVSTLTDQRALVSLRSATEAACPCASFTGGPGATAGAYQRCARTVLTNAVQSGDLRKECKKTANAINRGAVCGSTKVACGRYSPKSKTPLSCRLKSASSCKDAKTFEQNTCTAQTYCADVVDWTASTCVDARAGGAFAAGVRVIRYTKSSVVNPSQSRVLDTVIWYPAAAGAGPLDATYNAVLNAPLDDTAAPYPLLMFSHGSCGIPTQSTFLLPLLASHGFIVAAPPHPGNTLLDFPGCNTAQAQVASAVERPQDILFVLDALLAANDDSASPFFGAVDADRLGMSGHSFGGFTTYVTTSLDPRFKIAMPLAPFVGPAPPLTIPSLTMLGQIDSVVSDDAIRTAYAGGSAPKFLVEIANAGHYAFSDLCFPSADCNPPTTLTQDEAHDAVRRWVLPFLKVYLAGDASFSPFLAPITGPGFVFDATR